MIRVRLIMKRLDIPRIHLKILRGHSLTFLKNFLNGFVLRVADLGFKSLWIVIMQKTPGPVWTRSIEMRVISDTLSADVTLEISAGTTHFVTSVFFDEGFLAFIASLDEGCAHGFFDDVFGRLLFILFVL